MDSFTELSNIPTQKIAETGSTVTAFINCKDVNIKALLKQTEPGVGHVPSTVEWAKRSARGDASLISMEVIKGTAESGWLRAAKS
ncbi:MAG: hypothetical protein LC803_22155 [Acidobacteria bacterium]|nr:hypothetical protein [Acidobacteriota bacterium]